MKQILLTIIVIFTFTIQAQSSLVILELFTSQGCSSCPSADKLLKEVYDNYPQDEVIVLSYHVDYWNYIGWKDPFSNAKFTQKQREYGSKFKSSSIYTPQIVVNGKEHFVGSNRSIMMTKLKEYSNEPSENSIRISNITKENALITFNYNAEGKLDKRWLSIYLVINDKLTEVKRGENRNRTLQNTNIVANEKSLELHTSGKVSISIPDFISIGDELSLIAITQKSNLDITGGMQITLN